MDAPVSEGPWKTRSETLAWLRQQGLEAFGGLCAEVLAPELEARSLSSLRHALSRHRLSDLASPEGIAQIGYGVSHLPGREQIPDMVWHFFQRRWRDAERARQQPPTRWPAPKDPAANSLFQALLLYRQDFPDRTPPRPKDVLEPGRLMFAAQLPGFDWKGEPRCEGEGRYGFIEPAVQVRLSANPDEIFHRCTCHASHCHHALAVVDTVLLWLSQEPLREDRRHRVEALCKPRWEHALSALESALQSAQTTAKSQLSWRLRIIEGFGVEVRPYVQRPTAKGGLTTGSRVAPAVLLGALRSVMDARDLRVAATLPAGSDYAPKSALLELIHHPRVVLEEDPRKAVSVELAQVGLVALQRGASVLVAPGLDGTPLPEKQVQQLERAEAEDVVFLWEPGKRTVTLLEMAGPVRNLLSVFETWGNEFPPESHPGLLEKLSLASAQMPVAMPQSVLGERIPAECQPVLRLQVTRPTLIRVEILVRPLPESASYVAGEGPKDVHVRRGEALLAFHARREFDRELTVARQIETSLMGVLQDATSIEPFVYAFENGAQALALLDLARTLSPCPLVEWRGEPVRVAGRGDAKSLRVILERKRDWFGMLGALSVEGERVALAVALDAARRQQKYVEAQPLTYVEISDALRERLEALSHHAVKTKHGWEIGPSAVDAVDSLAQAGADVSADETWQTLAARIFAAKDLRPRLPASLQTSLRDYQVEGYTWMMRLAEWGAGAVLADDMGLGKTVQALAMLLARAKEGPALVLAPTSVGFNWVEEAERFAPLLRFHVYADSADRGAQLAKLGARDVLVLSYGLLSRDIERLAQVKFATIVFDEAQELKNATTHRARAARALQADFRLALSGTPVENHLGELWSLLRIVFPGLLGSWEAFRTRFALPIEKRIDPTAAPALARVLQPFLLRRTKLEVERELPARTEVRVPVVLSEPEWTLYEDARLSALSDLETRSSQLKEQERRVQVLASLTRLRLLASHPRLYDASSNLGSAKMERLMALVEPLVASGHKALIFSQFTSHLALVREVLEEKKIRYEYLDGQTPRPERSARVKAFQNGSAPLFLLSLKAGGFGLNLTAADDVIHLDPWWNPAVENQAADRAHRLGQTKPVTIYRLVTKGTIEEKMLELQEEKRALVEAVLEGKGAAARYSSSELLALLTEDAPLARMKAVGGPH